MSDAQAITPDQYFGILESLADGVVVQGLDGRLIYVNPVARRMIRMQEQDKLKDLAPDELIKKFQLIGKDGKELELEDMPGRRAVASGEPVEIIIGTRVNGKFVRWMLAKSQPLFDKDGKLEMVATTWQDITRQKQTELRLKEANSRITKLLEDVLK